MRVFLFSFNSTVVYPDTLLVGVGVFEIVHVQVDRTIHDHET